MKRHCVLLCCCCLATAALGERRIEARQATPAPWIVYQGKGEPAGRKGKHLVFLTGDEEYRSEEGLPMLAKILAYRHGFKCTVLFAIDKDGFIDPINNATLPGAEALDSADAIVMLLRYRTYPDETMKHFVDAFERGVPIIGLRTSTHAFTNLGKSQYKKFGAFGKQVLGEQWVDHWGRHKQEATRGIIEPSAKDDPLLRGVVDIFGDSDVYEAYPPADAKILVRGQVLKGMKPSDPPADYKRKRTTDKKEQGINDPMMPVAWTRLYKNDAGKENKIFCTTMGAATDLQSEGLRRLVVNAVYWGLGLDVPAKADVAYIGDYKPTMYGFKGFKKKVMPAQLAVEAKDLPEPPPSKDPKLRAMLEGHSQAVLSLAFSGNGKLLASGGGDKAVKLWDATTGKEWATLQSHDDAVAAVAFSPDSRVVASASEDRTILLWEVAGGKVRAKLQGHGQGVTSVAFNGDGTVLASGSYDGKVRLWDVRTGQTKAILKGHKGGVLSVAFSRDGKLVASGDRVGTIKLWDARTGAELATLHGHTSVVLSVTFSGDAAVLASGDWDGTIKLWDVRTCKETATLKKHEDSVWSVRFSPCGTLLASGGGNKTIKLWDMATGTEKATLQGHSDGVAPVAFSADGTVLAAGSWQGPIALWDMPPAKKTDK